MELVKNGLGIPVCPEQLAGLSTPRVPAEILNGKVVDKNGLRLTEKFVHGAQEALKIAILSKCDQAYLKSKSPMCGCGQIYDGTFSKKLIEGDGIFTQLLKKNGINVQDISSD